MKRRELIKSLSLISIAGSSALMLSGCTKESVDPKKETELSDREKLIVNRGIMSVADINNPTEFELSHLPNIEILETDSLDFTRVDITVGSQGIIHPVSSAHWIDYIKLFLDDKLVALNEFEVDLARGFTSFYAPLDEINNISVEIGCNLHGIWKNIVSI